MQLIVITRMMVTAVVVTPGPTNNIYREREQQ